MSKPMTRSNTLRQQHASPLFASSLAVQAAGDDPDIPHKKLGPIVALRATMRKATGLSLTAMYAGCYGFTSGIVRNNMKRVLRVFPTWVSHYLVRNEEEEGPLGCMICSCVAHIFLPSHPPNQPQFRYFLQPFLILYYVPLYMLRTWTSPKKRRERSDLYDDIMLDFKRGVQAADKALDDGYWPIQMSRK